jgi:UDPglucose 6-dehydrogenase
MTNIGIIGNGFVGGAIAHGFSLWSNLRIYDTNPKLSTHTFKDVIDNSDFVFVCVPTPMDMADNRSIDLTILDSVMSEIDVHNDYFDGAGPVIIIKSTVIPGTTKKYEKLYPSAKIVFNPEFLSERTARADFNNPSRLIIGGNKTVSNRVADLYRERFPHVTIVQTDSESAEFTKYACNCFYAVKISILNEFHHVADKQQLDWNSIMAGMLTSGWINPMHTLVPGTDGNLGFGGKCFPKDISAFINYFEDSGVNPSIMKASWQKNIEVRKQQNWLHIEGAVSNKKGE